MALRICSLYCYRCVPDNQRSLALGLQLLIGRLLGKCKINFNSKISKQYYEKSSSKKKIIQKPLSKMLKNKDHYNLHSSITKVIKFLLQEFLITFVKSFKEQLQDPFFLDTSLTVPVQSGKKIVAKPARVGPTTNMTLVCAY